MINNNKLNKLEKVLKDLESVLVAFSGGVDSTFLLYIAKKVLGDNVKAVTISSPYIPKWEIEEAKKITEKLNIKHQILKVNILKEIEENPENRCYLCKKILFSTIRKLAKDQGYKYVVDGSNIDDLGDYRPGMIALKELDIVSPMLLSNICKEDIRILSKDFDLPTWNKPAYACLLTRIPYGNKFEIKDFEMIETAEKFMMCLGFKAVRVRKHGELARIEVSRERIKDLFDMKLFDKISKKIKEIGFSYVTLDMQGYRMGSFNKEWRNNEIRRD